MPRLEEPDLQDLPVCATQDNFKKAKQCGRLLKKKKTISTLNESAHQFRVMRKYIKLDILLII